MARRHAPPVAPAFSAELQERYGFFTKEHAEAMHILWFVLTKIVPSMFWQLRDDTVHEGTEIAPANVTLQI